MAHIFESKVKKHQTIKIMKITLQNWFTSICVGNNLSSPHLTQQAPQNNPASHRATHHQTHRRSILGFLNDFLALLIPAIPIQSPIQLCLFQQLVPVHLVHPFIAIPYFCLIVFVQRFMAQSIFFLQMFNDHDSNTT